MKKILLALMMTFGMAHAVDFELPQIDPCADFGLGCPGPQGEQGIPGIDGIDGIDGAKGDTGEQGETGLAGADGIDGADGTDGKTGRTGLAGEDGEDGKDFTAYNEFLEYGKKATEYYEDLAAGSAAMAAIDFGSTAKGVWEAGLGIGHSSSFDGSSTVGAVGLKYGFTDNEAVIVKTWYSESDSYAVGAALTTRF